MENHTTPMVCLILTLGHNLYKLGRGQLGNATNKIKRSRLNTYGERDFSIYELFLESVT